MRMSTVTCITNQLFAMCCWDAVTRKNKGLVTVSRTRQSCVSSLGGCVKSVNNPIARYCKSITG